ncbi:hypothetical protein Glove_294g52 [Diversispora epigaea]|uniref:Mitochondrial escape protein 2 n=1 Tax=Diversispora epigaea TaxID=1348612 RepID=A0A397I0B8_9GLOM|nr:hypothetical protein Glove_294g52 [Diversispora epigaea]
MLFRVFTVLAHKNNYNLIRLPFSNILNRNQNHFSKHFKLINLRHFSESKPFYYSEIVETIPTNSTEKTPQIPPQIHYGKLFFDNIYPLKIGSFDFRHYFVRSNIPRLERKVKSGKWIPLESIMPYNFKVEGVIPRKKEGGMLLEFSYQVDPSQKTKALDEISKLVNDHLVEHNVVPWFNPRPQKAYIVKGKPFVEDLSLYPSSRLRVEFQGPDVSIKSLYPIFRPYGLMRHIFLMPSSSKETPRYATIIYKKMRSATSARYCVDGISINSTKFDIFYETPLKTNVFFNWVASHPRISGPIIAAILAGISYIIFDPIRIFLIESNITQRFDIKEYKIYEIYKWLKKETYERFKNQDVKLEEDTLAWKEREQEEEILKKWLSEPPETFIIVSGPNGSGKSKFINRAIHNKKKKIIIKCDQIRISHNENEFVLKLAKQVGYKPMFFSLIYLSNLIDGLASAVTGQKTVGFSSTTDSEIEKILDALEIALYNIAPDVFKAKVNSSRKSDLYAEHIYQSYDPEDIPVLIIDSFISKNAQENMELWDHLAQMAARLVEKKIAHVVFESSVTGIVRHLSKFLPSKTFNIITLSDAPFERSISLVKKNVKGTDGVSLEGLESSVQALGGRFSYLSLFIDKIRGGKKPSEALNELVARAKIEILKLAFGDNTEDAKSIPWSDIQFWAIMKRLASNGILSFEEIKSSPFFKDDDTSIREMEDADLILIVQSDDKITSTIKPGNQLYRVAFQQICSVELFKANMELKTNKYLYNFMFDKIKKYEEELQSLGKSLVRQDGKWLWVLGNDNQVPITIKERVDFLLDRIHKCHIKNAKYQEEIDKWKKVIEISGKNIEKKEQLT